jgi:hypothetical protein
MGIKKRRVKNVAQNFMRKKLSTIATFSMDPYRNLVLFNTHIEFLQTMKRESHEIDQRNENCLL